jgi:tetratricopeptide (TPR) repeat protein
MKKTFILMALVVAFSATFAQKGKVTTAETLMNEGKLDKALAAIEEAANASDPKAEKSFNWPKTFQVRGQIFQAIGQSKDENFKKLSSDPLTEALSSYKKAMELDPKHSIDKSVKMNLVLLANDLTNQAVQAFQAEDYNKALASFEQYMEINNLPVIKADNPNAIDTVIIFNSALAAYNAEQYDKAIGYYKEAAKYGYSGARTYTLMAAAYQMKKDTLSALATYQEGMAKYQDDKSLLDGLIQTYIDLNKTDEALDKLDLAIKKDATNPRYHHAKGAMYEKMGKEADAIDAYKKAAEVDTKFFDAFYNLGALYYNKGVQQIDIAKEVPANDNKRYEAELKKSDEWFVLSLPYMEKCHEIDAADIRVLDSLKNLYYRLKMMDKYNAILEEIEKNK